MNTKFSVFLSHALAGAVGLVMALVLPSMAAAEIPAPDRLAAVQFSAPTTSQSPSAAIYGVVCVDNVPQFGVLNAPTLDVPQPPTPTAQTFPNALTASPSPIVPGATATSMPPRPSTPTQVTPALPTHTPQATPTFNIGACDWIGIGAAWYQPRGNAFYEYTDPGGTHIQEQNIRSGPGTAYPIVGKLPLRQPREVWHYIDFVDQRWISLDATCDQWVGVWLGFIDVK